MAIMHPSKVYRFRTMSEKALYEALRTQLSDKYEVFYSVSWYGKDEDKKRINSEADFIVVDREKGFICIEVKGGVSYAHEGNHYVVTNGDGTKISRNISAFEQAENSMHYFHDVYEENYKAAYQGVYGYVVAFPFYKMKDRAGEFFQVPDVIIDLDDMGGNLESTIRRAFLYWQGRNKMSPELFVDSAKKNLCSMLKRVYSIEASKGALIEAKQEELDRINSMQESILNMLSNYKSFAIKGAAGTGKSWIAFKMALNNSTKYHRKTLLISKSKYLSEYFKKQITDVPSNLVITDYDSFIQRFDASIIESLDLKPEDKFTTIIIDEAQDFSEQEAILVRALLSDDRSARINIFYDDEQTLNDDDELTPKKFLIDTPPYLLTENLRNTKNIYEWAKERTPLGETSFSNQVDGIEPIHSIFRNDNQIGIYLKTEIDKLLSKDKLSTDRINVVIDDDIYDLFSGRITDGIYNETGVNVFGTEEYKGLEADVVFYVHSQNNKYEYRYVGLTRARFVLYDIEMRSVD